MAEQVGANDVRTLEKPLIILIGANPERGGPKEVRAPNPGSLPPAWGSMPPSLPSLLAGQSC